MTGRPWIVLGRRPARVPTALEAPCPGHAITEIRHVGMLLTRFDIDAEPLSVDMARGLDSLLTSTSAHRQFEEALPTRRLVTQRDSRQVPATGRRQMCAPASTRILPHPVQNSV